MFSLLTELSDAKKLAGQRFHVIFFAENAYYFQYYRFLFETLLAVPGIRVAYITSDKTDVVLMDKRVQAFYLKNTLAGIFPRLQADVLIMTMPDLQNFIFKKSAAVGKYIYVFHALVSTHQQYRLHAFDHYDAVFCTGPQHELEIRETEKLYSLPAKDCIAFGYPLLDDLKEKTGTVNHDKVLIAPSWYTEGILNTCIIPLVEALQNERYQVWIRPHPEFVKRSKKVYDKLMQLAKKNNTVHFDTSPNVFTHLLDAGFLVTDRSGIALEYAFTTCSPVLFIDTPLKIQNPESGKLSIEPLENAFRQHLGQSVQPNALQTVNEVLQELKRSAEACRTSIQKIENAVVFPSPCHQNGIDYILKNLSL